MRQLVYFISISILAALAFSACSGEAPTAPPQIDQATQVPEATEVSALDGEETTTEELGSIENIVLPDIKPAEVPGDVVTAGSSTVFPLAEVIAGMYEGEGGGNITIDSIGSGAGFERFCDAGESDVSNASRAINSSEIEAYLAIYR